MLISHSHQFIFVHIPKVAGSSLSHALLPYLHYNLNLSQAEKADKVRFFDEIKEKATHKNLTKEQQAEMSAYLEHLSSTSDSEVQYMYEDSSPRLFHELVPSYLNANHPKVYSQFLQHDTAKGVQGKVPPNIYNNYFKFVFVRNPLEWLVSLYHYSLQKDITYLNRFIKRLGSFEGYVNYLYDCHLENRTQNIFGHVHWETMADYIFDDQDNCLVDFIGKLENFSDDLRRLSTILDIELEVPHKNKSSHSHYLTEYNSDMVTKAKSIMARDFDLLKYSRNVVKASM